MAFGLSMRSVPYVTTYADAVAMYGGATAWRGEDPAGERPLPDKRSRDYGVRIDGTDVVFRYHNTDVVRWHANGSYTLNTGGYHTNSTGTFATNFMPRQHYLQKEATHLRIKDRLYPIAGHKVTVSTDEVPSGEGLGRFAKRTVNRKRATALLATLGYPAYRAWYETMLPMVRDTMPPTWRRDYYSADAIKESLGDPEMWHGLMMSTAGSPAQVREAMYSKYEYHGSVYDYEYRDFLGGSIYGRGWDVVGAA